MPALINDAHEYSGEVTGVPRRSSHFKQKPMDRYRGSNVLRQPVIHRSQQCVPSESVCFQR